MDKAAASLLPSLLEKSVSITLCVIVIGAMGYAIWTLWKANQGMGVAHAIALAEVNSKRLSESEKFAQERQAHNDQMRTLIEGNTVVLKAVQADRPLCETDRRMLSAIATKVNVSLSDLQ